MSSVNHNHDEENVADNHDDRNLSFQRFKSFPLARSLLINNDVRITALKEHGHTIHDAVKGNAKWLRTIFVIRERALDTFIVPWLLVTINAIIWTILIKTALQDRIEVSADSWGSLFSLVLTTTLAFLLVFRLNRVAVRWWDTRRMWGIIVERSRVLACGILEHASHAPDHRDNAIAWLATFVISVKNHIRFEKKYEEDELAGYLSFIDISPLSCSNNPCLYAATEIRHELKHAFKITSQTPAAIGAAFSSEFRMLERSIDTLVAQMGGLERVRSTPLPIVYVAHLRTFLMIYLLSLPYLHGNSWGWGTIPAVCLTAFALLGIDGAAAECESPFKKGRPNHLDMEAYCLVALDNIEQLVVHYAELQLRDDATRDYSNSTSENM